MALINIAMRPVVIMRDSAASWAITLAFLISLDSNDMDFYCGLDERSTRR